HHRRRGALQARRGARARAAAAEENLVEPVRRPRSLLMPSLRVAAPGKAPKVYPLYKKITSIGRSEENDVVLDDPLLAESHAHIHFDGRDFNVTAIDRNGDLSINGKKRKKHRLVHEDVMKIGGTELTFSLYDEAQPAPSADDDVAKTQRSMAADAYSKVYEFSERLLANYELPSLLDALMDACVEI